MMTFVLPSWCVPQSSYLMGKNNVTSMEEGIKILRDVLHPSASTFLLSLNLPWIHPFCESLLEKKKIEQELLIEAISSHTTSSSSPIAKYMTFNNSPRLIFILYKQTIPALAALTELWLRLLSFYIAPFCICYLIHLRVMGKSSLSKPSEQKPKADKLFFIVSLTGLVSAAVLFTDPLYVHEFGRSFGAILFGTVLLLISLEIINLCSSSHHSINTKTSNSANSYVSGAAAFQRIYWWFILGLAMVMYQVTFHVVLHPEHTMQDIPQLEPGLYYDKSNQLMEDIADLWPNQLRTYDDTNGKTPWTITGDSRTGIPFLINSIPEQRYHRVWVPSASFSATAGNDILMNTNVGDEEEANALDIAFPPDGRFNKHMPFYIILHGLNGGSDEEYVKEFVMQQTQRGSTVAVMIARGLMGTPIIGKNVFHGARVSDINQVAKVIKKNLGEEITLVGVGYSMGAIIMSNYVARSGRSCYLDAAVAVSGALDMKEQINFYRSMRLWQPMLAQGLRDTIMKGVRTKYEERLTEEQYFRLMHATHVTAIDEDAVVTYNGFHDILHYYSEMSAMGDWSSRESPGRIANISIPLCVIHALDDPLVSWRAVVGNNQPETVVTTGEGYLMLLLTKSGGHVGWPVGINPKRSGWGWMNGAITGFVDAYEQASEKKKSD